MKASVVDRTTLIYDVNFSGPTSKINEIDNRNFYEKAFHLMLGDLDGK